MAVRYCKTHGAYRGLVCAKCHPRGTGELAEMRRATHSETMTPTPLFEQPTATGQVDVSYNHYINAPETTTGQE